MPLSIPQGHQLRSRSDQGWLTAAFREANAKWYEQMLGLIERVNRAADGGLYETPADSSGAPFEIWLKDHCFAFGWDYHYYNNKLVIEWHSAKNTAASPLEKVAEAVQELDMSLLLVHDVLSRGIAVDPK